MDVTPHFSLHKLVIMFLSAAMLSIAPGVHALDTGDKAPGFSLPRLERTGTLSLKQYRGKVVYVDFWASWCGPCRKSLPELNDIRKSLRKKGFEVIAVNLDEDKEEALDFLKQHPVGYPTVRDVSGKTPSEYKVRGMPSSYLVDRKGIVRYVHEGYKSSDKKHITEKIQQILRQK